MKRSTIKEVAARANVSTATVSRVINNIGTVTPENRKKVMEAVSELNYFSNSSAKNLKENSTKIIGIVVPNMSNEYFMQLIKGIEDQFETASYVFYIASSDGSAEKEKAILTKLFESRAEAILIATVGQNDDFIENLSSLGQLIVAIDRRIETNHPLDFFGEDNFQSAYLLTKTLLKQGYQEFGIIGGLMSTSVGRERVEGCRLALSEADVNYVFCDGHFNEESGQQCFIDIIKNHPKLDMVISLNNEMTAGVVNELFERRSLGKTDSVRIASFGEIKFQHLFSDIITDFVRQNPYKIGINTGKLLKRKLINGSTEINVSLEPTELVNARELNGQVKKT